MTDSPPPEFDPQRQADFISISDMMTSAAEYSLEVEVVLSFGAARAAGSNVQDACREALYEWDI